MVITYYGASCFKVQSGETVLVFNPPSKDSEFKSPRFQANMVLLSYNHKDFNGWDNLSGKKEGEAPFIIDGPGEYEIGGIYVKGLATGRNDLEQGINTVYAVSVEDISLCHLGAANEKELGAEITEDIGEIDILFTPIGGENVLDSTMASHIISQLEPKIAIPSHYKEADLKKFQKEFGNGPIKPVDKLTIKKKDLGEQKAEIVVLEPMI